MERSVMSESELLEELRRLSSTISIGKTSISAVASSVTLRLDPQVVKIALSRLT
jgi:hypothetical protein